MIQLLFPFYLHVGNTVVGANEIIQFLKAPRGMLLRSNGEVAFDLS